MRINDNLKQGLKTGLGMIQTRLKLIGTELLLEHKRLSSLLMNLTLVGCCFIALTQIGVLLIWLAWPAESRIWALTVAGCLAAAFTATGIIRMRILVKHDEKPFNATIEELQKDVECIQSLLNRN